MSLEDDLKAKTLSLISQQMANWVVDIQRQIADHQGNLVRTLDELQENVARYDEKINEADIEMGIAEVVSANPPAPSGPGMDRLRASLHHLERGANLSEVLTHLVDEVSQYADRAAMFIVKGPSAIGWYARGVSADAVKQINIPLTADTVFRQVSSSRAASRAHVSQSHGTAQALARLGGHPQGLLAVPLLLRDKLAAILYCDTTQPEIPAANADLIEVLVAFAGKNIDLISLAPKPAAAAPAPAPTPAPPARPAPAPPPAARVAAAAPRAADEGSSTVMFNAASFAQARQQPAPAPRPAPPPPAPVLSPEEQKMHEDAKRFARLVVSEIKLYNEAKVAEGRRSKDLYGRLKDDIERGRVMYHERVNPAIRDTTNYFHDELVRILAGGDPSALGHM